MSYHTCPSCKNSFHLNAAKELPASFLCSTCFSNTPVVKEFVGRAVEQRNTAIRERLAKFAADPKASEIDALFKEVRSIMKEPVPEKILLDYDTWLQDYKSCLSVMAELNKHYQLTTFRESWQQSRDLLEKV